MRPLGHCVTLLIFFGLVTPGAAQDPASKTFDCLMEPRFQVKISAGTAGILKDVLVDRGDAVHRGQLLAQIDDGVEAAADALARARAADDSTLRSRQARLEFLARKRSRQEQLRAKGAGTEAAFDEADSDFRQATQDVAEAVANLKIAALEANRTSEVVKLKSILSPIEGVVVDRTLYRGEYAYEQAPIMTVAQIDPLAVQVFLPVSFYPDVKVGMDADVFPEQPVGGAYKAHVDVVDSVFDARSGTFGVRLLMPNPQNHLPAGLRCRINFAAK